MIIWVSWFYTQILYRHMLQLSEFFHDTVKPMASRTLISVEEYLRTSYRPDCDYVDGEVLERNVGELDHSWLQTALSSYLFARRGEWNITVLVEQRVQVSTTRFRIPDVCVILGPKPAEQILTRPP